MIGQSSIQKTDLILGMGNDFAGDDAVGLHIARAAAILAGPSVEVIETPEAGLAILELIIGYRRVVIADSVQTRQHPIGTVIVLGRHDFGNVIAPSAHYAGLPEVLSLGERLELDMPEKLAVVAVETEIPTTFHEGLSRGISLSVPLAVFEVLNLVSEGSAWDRVEFEQPAGQHRFSAVSLSLL